MSWGEGPLNAWSLLLALFLMASAIWGVLARFWTWRERAREALEDHAALERGEPTAV